MILADNAGYDSSDLTAKLRAAHFEGRSDSGLGMFSDSTQPKVPSNHLADMYEGTIASMRELGVTESYKLKRQVVLSASEAAEMILRWVLIYYWAAGECSFISDAGLTLYCVQRRGSVKLISTYSLLTSLTALVLLLNCYKSGTCRNLSCLNHLRRKRAIGVC